MNSVKYLFYMELLNYLFCDMFGGILECYELTHVLPYPDPTRQSCMSGQALLPHWLCNQKHPWGICSCSPIVSFLKVPFYHGMVTLVIFLIKNNLNRHIKHENLLSIYENMNYFQIMLFIVTCWKFQKIQQPYIKRYFYVFFSTNIVEMPVAVLVQLKHFYRDHHHHHHHHHHNHHHHHHHHHHHYCSLFAYRPKDLDNHKDTHFHKGFQAHWMWTLFKRSCRFSWA